MKTATITTALASLVLLSSTDASAQLVNGAFDQGLEGWQTTAEGNGTSPGEARAVSGGAELVEGDAFLVSLTQSFVVPERTQGLAFTVEATPGWDTTGSKVPDAFEAHLTDGEGAPLTATWRQGASAFYRLGDDGKSSAADGVTVSGGDVELSLASVSAGATAQLAFHLIGGDDDTGSGVRVSAVRLLNPTNQAPTADAGDDVAVACGAEVNLDGSASTDPDGDALSYAWSEGGASIGDGAAVALTFAPGAHALTLTVNDPFGGTSTDTVSVTVAACTDGGDGDGDGDGDGGVGDGDGDGDVGPGDGDGDSVGSGDGDGDEVVGDGDGTGVNPACACRADAAGERGLPWGLLALLTFLGGRRRCERASAT